MPPETYQFTYFSLFQDILLGVAGMILILIFHGIMINTVLMRFERMTEVNLAKKSIAGSFFTFTSPSLG